MPQLGDYMVTATGGWAAPWIRRFTHSKVNHAAIYVGANQIVEAQPKGAVFGSVNDWPDAIWSHVTLTGSQRLMIATRAKLLVGTKYNYLDIAAQLIVRQFGWHAPQWAINRLSRPDRLQCAQLVDDCYEWSGVSLFPDGRPNGLVAPSDLLDIIK